MGVDIHLSVIDSSGNYIKKDIDFGRNTEWFDDMCGRGYDRVYDTLPMWYGLPEVHPEKMDKDLDDYCYDPRYINVGEYINWFLSKRPDVDAYFLTVYEKWLYESKGIYPENGTHYKDEENGLTEFTIVKDEHELGKSLFEEVRDLPKDSYIVYYFDN